MANGPLGGFMPTPPSPGQPPQVKLETSAESRGAFNKFLGTLPSNGAIAPIQTGVVPSSTAPVTPMTGNVNIFQPQMSQMTAMPIMPPAQPVQMMQFGGEAEESIVGDDPDAGFDFDDDTGSFDVAEQPDVTEDEQQQNIEDSQTFMDTPISSPVVDTRPRTNITNVGPTSNLRFDPQFTADLLGRQFGDSNIAGFMSKDDFAQTTQGGATAPTLTSGLPSFGLGQGFQEARREAELAKLRPGAGVAPVTTTVGTGATTTPNELDLLGLGGLGVDLSSTDRDRLGFGRARTREAFGVDKNLDPLGITTINQTGKPMSKDESQRIIDSLMSGVNRPKDNTGVQVASLGGLRGQIDRLGSPGLTGTALTAGLPSIDTVADDLVRGRGLGENINNPGNIRAGGGFDGEIGRTRDGFAIFDSMQSGVDAINKLSNTYGSKRNINTVREFANRYSPVGENTAKEVSGKINFLSNALGVGPDDKVDFTDPNVQAVFTPALITSEIGRDRAQNVANVLSGFSPSPLNVTTRDLNPNITSNVNQLGAIDTTSQTDAEARDRTLGEALANDFLNARRMPGTAVSDFLNLATTTQNVSPENTAARIARNNRTINQIRDDLNREALSRVPDTALETLADRRDLNLSPPPENFEEAVGTPGVLRQGDLMFAPGAGRMIFNPAFVKPSDQIELRELRDIDEAIEVAGRGPLGTQNLQSRTALGGRGTSPTTDLFRGPQVSIVGDDPIAPLETRDIVGDVTQERVADILSRPDRFKDTFTIGDKEFPNIIATLANKVGSLFDRRLFDAITKKGLDAVVDPDTGRIIGAKDEFGNLIEGRNLSSIGIATSDNEPSPIVRPRTPKPEEDEKPSVPNVFGGGTPRTLENIPTVVSSPFTSTAGDYKPVSFDAGNLNALIERITGVPSPRRMQEGGTVAAVDRFLSKVA